MYIILCGPESIVLVIFCARIDNRSIIIDAFNRFVGGSPLNIYSDNGYETSSVGVDRVLRRIQKSSLNSVVAKSTDIACHHLGGIWEVGSTVLTFQRLFVFSI